MAFTTSNTYTSEYGDKRVLVGTFVNTSASTGGTINSGFNRIENITLQYTGTSTALNAAVVSQSIPLNSGDVKIVTVANTSGTFKIEGY